MHRFSHFKFELLKTESGYEMRFISCEEYGYSEVWKKGDLFGYIDSIQNEEGNIYQGRINEHRRAGKLELTPHLIQLKDDTLIIFTGERYRDYYVKI